MTNKNIPEVEVQRRRKGEKPVRQESPIYRRGSGGGSVFRPTSGKLGCGGLFIVILLILFMVFSNQGGSDNSDYLQEPNNSELIPTQVVVTNTARPTRQVSSGGSDQTWLVMLYQDADDQTLEQDIYIDFNEVEKIGSSNQVTIVSQIDRFRGGFQGNEDWYSSRRYLITQDHDLSRIQSQLIADLGEVNMAAGDSLVDFVTWAVDTYPADRYALILSDHGMGWPGGWSDPSPGNGELVDAPISRLFGVDSIILSELDQALSEIQSLTGIEKLDLIGIDACLMSQIEVYAALQPYAHYAVASEETEPGLGWAYAAFLGELTNDPAIDGGQLAQVIVDTYINEDQRIVDDQARMDFLRQGGSVGGFFGTPRVSAEQLASQLDQNITLTTVDLNKIPNLITSYNQFVYALQNIDQRIVASARNYSQSYTSIFGRQVPPSYIDLGHFVLLTAKQSHDSSIQQQAQQVFSALQEAVIPERHGKSKPGSTGIAIYFPNSTLYRSPYTGMQSYSVVADRFAKTSLWDDFLVFHYSNQSFRSDAVEAVQPPSGGLTRVPGLGNIILSEINSSTNSVSPVDSVRLSVDISGDNIGYIYLFTGLYDTQSNSILVADTDYLESPESESLNGVTYPLWPDAETFRMSFDWEPLLFTITDGLQYSVALFNPVSYGAVDDDAVYAVQGTYTFASSGEQRRAVLYFKDGRLFQIFGFLGDESAGAPAEISPEVGVVTANIKLNNFIKKLTFASYMYTIGSKYEQNIHW